MRRIITFSPFLAVLVLGAWLMLVNQGDDTGQGSDSISAPEVPAASQAANPEAPTSSQSRVPDATMIDERQQGMSSEEWEYAHVFRQLADEPEDQTWAPQAAATIDNTIRSMGGYIRDVNVNCRTTRCGAVILYRAEFFALDEDLLARELTSMLQKLDALEVVVQGSPRLTSYTAAGLVDLTTTIFDGSNPTESIGTTVSFVSQSRQD